ncbi:L,D-transpeptidase family protein [Vibrio sp. TRT 17S01]|uniref:L,D-transpeptidase family protein n=1 Tax=Vibrio sp. TRT 17S01 TaxID=3418505 RepID=UPI003CE9535C
MIKVRLLLLVFLCIPVQANALEYFEHMGWMKPNDKLETLIQYPELVERIYRKNDAQLIWFDLQQSSKLEFQLEVIQRAGFSPMFSKRLNHLQFYRKSNRWFEYDLLATDTLIAYLSYAEQASAIGTHWFFESKLKGGLPQPSQASMTALYAAVETQQMRELVESYTPDSDGYEQLVNTYLHLQKYHKLDLPLYHQKGLKRAGDILEDREALLARLEVVDIDLSKTPQHTSWYDNELEKAVKRFQSIHGLTADGIIGPSTLKWLNMPPESRLSTLALNAERLRLWPMQRDALIMVNVPSFEMKYWYLGEEVFESKVVVGRTSRQTPVMTTNLDSLILNPTWNVPRKIMVEDILPKVKKDSEYLAKHNYQIIPKWNSYDSIDPQEIDWSTLEPRNFPYKMRQMSGNYNALGLYKFNTPNARAIYLHDTPSKYLFNNSRRAFSSGCIRVEHADQFASRLLQSQGLDPHRLSQSEGAPNKAIPLKRRIPVHIIYQTAWFEEGVVHYRDDIYRFDKFSYTKG